MSCPPPTVNLEHWYCCTGASYYSLCTLGHGQACGWLTLDKPADLCIQIYSSLENFKSSVAMTPIGVSNKTLWMQSWWMNTVICVSPIFFLFPLILTQSLLVVFIFVVIFVVIMRACRSRLILHYHTEVILYPVNMC